MSMARTLKVAEAKARFSEALRKVEAGEHLVVTRHGKPVAALVPAPELAELERLRAAGPARGLAGLAGGWKGSDALVRQVARLRRSAPRKPARMR